MALIKEILGTREPEHINDEGTLYKHAGVLIPILMDNGVPKILFTKRTNKVEHHKGQISFPGGAVDEQDSSVEQTALREAEEEIGLLREDVELLGRIDDTLTRASGFIVHPFVGLIPYPYEFTINGIEVERLLMVPLSSFNVKDSKRLVEFEGRVYLDEAYEYNGDLIWGATARMMKNFMEIIDHRLVLPQKTD
jgi:8-oxo-dGTP pyrophosphatase MutT (NUDIX family)